MKAFNVAVVGATGAVGNEMIETLAQRSFPVRNLKLLASERSAGTVLTYKGHDVKVEVLKEDSFKGVEIGLFSAGGAVSQKFAPLAAAAGCVVIDNTNAFRMDADIPLVVPEVNAHALRDYGKRGIIANPNCSTIQMVVVLKPLHDAARIKRVVVSTYQAVSGTGKRAIAELESQITSIYTNKEVRHSVYPHQIAFNCLPHIDVFLENGYTKEEMKMANETRKIMEDPNIKVTATTVRVPVFYGHSESVNVEFERELTAEDARKILSKAPGVVVADEPRKNVYPLAIYAAGKDETFVGRIRKDESVQWGLNMWIVADNIRKGAALNAVQIAEILAEKYL
ncbi:MAG: aspartate-semialdehyde dehydrogenase [Syntrophorhabdales bacterium]|jgi:aspartate-semialdehyde dehydrogenase